MDLSLDLHVDPPGQHTFNPGEFSIFLIGRSMYFYDYIQFFNLALELLESFFRSAFPVSEAECIVFL